MKKNSAFKLKSGNKPSMAKLSGVMKNSPAKQTFTHSTNVPKGTKTRADGTLSNPVKTDPSGRYMTPKTNFKTKPTLADGVTKDTRKTTKKKVTFAEAYKKRDMKTYGNLNLKEYTTEAKRQTKHKKDTTVKATPDGSVKGKKGSWDAPKSQMKGSVKPADKTSKTPSTPKETKLPVTKDSKKTQSVKDARAKRKEARKAVRTARKTSGRGSDEVKAAKAARKTARKNVRTAKKNRRATRKQSKEFAKN